MVCACLVCACLEHSFTPHLHTCLGYGLLWSHRPDGRPDACLIAYRKSVFRLSKHNPHTTIQHDDIALGKRPRQRSRLLQGNVGQIACLVPRRARIHTQGTGQAAPADPTRQWSDFWREEGRTWQPSSSSSAAGATTGWGVVSGKGGKEQAGHSTQNAHKEKEGLAASEAMQTGDDGEGADDEEEEDERMTVMVCNTHLFWNPDFEVSGDVDAVDDDDDWCDWW